MTMKWLLLILIHYDIIAVISPSIAGLTYMDTIDFEQKYKDVNECNPFHWYPLHLPEVCADMFENLIRSRLEPREPHRVMRERHPDDMYIKQYQPEMSDSSYEIGQYDNYMSRRPHREHRRRRPHSRLVYSSYKQNKHLTPYEKMLKLLKKDFKREPSVPKIGLHPNLGPVQIYNQEISKKSEMMIKELATAYGKMGQDMYATYTGYDDSPEPQLYVWDSTKNNTQAELNKKNKQNITRTKTQHGNVITIVETISPRKRLRRQINIKELLLFDMGIKN